jgi:nucleoside transporter
MGGNETAKSAAPPLAMALRLNLSVMMFLEFAIWGSWFTVLGNFIHAMKFTDADIGSVYATMPLGSILSPLIVGQIADRYVSSERLMAALHFLGALVLFWLAQITDVSTFYWVALLYSVVFSPTLTLTNSIAFTHLPDATRDFPSIRVLGTIGWIVAGLLVTAILWMFANSAAAAAFVAPQFSVVIGGTRMTLPLVLAGVLSVILGAWSLVLPHTPPTGKPGEAFPFVRALRLMKEPSFAVFYGVSFIITIVLAFYYNFTGIFLGDSQKVAEAEVSSYMAIGQVAEMGLLPLLPWFLNKYGMKWVLALGMLSWGIRYGLFALGGPFALILVGVALHGLCFDFFFAAGFIHVDNKAPKDIRASAQALFGFLTYGAGMWLGGELSGRIKGAVTDPVTKVTNWGEFWSIPAVGVLIALAIFLVFFRDNEKAGSPAVVPAGEAP